MNGARVVDERVDSFEILVGMSITPPNKLRYVEIQICRLRKMDVDII